ncbi:very short patch repair endonuclease, partial [bacterium]|nr:very short patch repair endonuclease [bacterium]
MAKTLEQISYNMSRIRSCGTVHEKRLCAVLCRRGFYSFECNVRDIPGQPDIVFRARRLDVFCDGDFWHGYDWEHRRDDLKSNRSYWIPKIERNMVHDRAVTFSLRAQGWTVMRFWEHEIKKDADDVADRIEAYLRRIPLLP